MNSLKFYETDTACVDLSKVEGIGTEGPYYNDALQSIGYKYKVAMKSGAVIEVEGFGLLAQFKRYKKSLDEIPPCESCAANDQPNCGMDHCVTRREDGK